MVKLCCRRGCSLWAVFIIYFYRYMALQAGQLCISIFIEKGIFLVSWFENSGQSITSWTEHYIIFGKSSQNV